MAKSRKHHTTLNTIKHMMRQKGITQRDLAPLIGNPSLVSLVLSGKREITMPMARALHKHLGIPAEVLLQEPGTDIEESGENSNWDRFPFRAMAKLKWIAEGWWDNGCPSGIFRLRESGDLGELPVEQQLAVEVELQRLADRGYREDRALWVYQHLLRKCGMWPQNARVPPLNLPRHQCGH